MAAELENSRVRELFSTLRTGDRGVSFEPLAHQLYFLQHRSFTLFDVLDAFRFSAGASERYLGYRDFQIALVKIARVKYEACASDMRSGANDTSAGNVPLTSRRLESDLVASLLEEIAAVHALTTRRMDALRRQLIKASVLDTLRAHFAKLVQGFQLYGTMNRITSGGEQDAADSITFEGFVDFLNAYFEYEDYFTYNDLAQMMTELQSAVNDGWRADRAAIRSQSTSAPDGLFFMQYVELFCRVASTFHHETLLREGAQLRRAIETCRLEFSIELLLQHMSITIIRDEEQPAAVVPIGLPGKASNGTEVQDATPVTESDGGSENRIAQSDRGRENASPSSTVEKIATMLAGFDTEKKASRHHSVNHHPHVNHSTPKHSVLFSRLPPRRSIPTRSMPSLPPAVGAASEARILLTSKSAASNHDERLDSVVTQSSRARPPQVVMIREVVSPPPMSASTLHLVESAIKYQNVGQYNMALSTLNACQAQLTDPGICNAAAAELRVFLDLLTASVLDSAHKDVQALARYADALKAAEMLPPDHPARLLMRSCMACTLFYMGELQLAKQAHQQVLDARKAAAITATSRDAVELSGSSNVTAEIDLATAMNNVACCLSQEEQTSAAMTGYSPLEEAFLLFKEAKRIYAEAFGPSHPRVEVVHRNLEHVRSCQVTVVTDPRGALERGEYAHVIPGSVFQIRALEPVKSLPKGKKGNKKKGGKKKGGKKKSK